MKRRQFLKATAAVGILTLTGEWARAEKAKLKMVDWTARTGEVWNDTNGQPIQAHGGGILHVNKTYYWFGENRNRGDDGHYSSERVRCYSSKDLTHWKDEGAALVAPEGDGEHELAPKNVVERPKVIYNKKTKKYVLWAHIDSPNYGKACAGVAVSDKPTGPYKYLGSVRPNGAMARDITVFQDDDSTAYLFFSSEENSTMHIVKLSDDYLTPTTTEATAFVKKWREAPAVFKKGSTYYILTSGCTGWDANAADYATASSPLGPWTSHGNPCVGENSDKTFGAQSAFVLPVAGKNGQFLALFDRWIPKNLADSRYVWLPVSWEGDKPVIAWPE